MDKHASAPAKLIKPLFLPIKEKVPLPSFIIVYTALFHGLFRPQNFKEL